MLDVCAGEDELELDYNEGSDEWEKGELHEEGGVALPVMKGSKRGGAIDQSVGVLQKSTVDDGGITRQWTEARSRGLNEGREPGGLPSGDKDWWSVWDTESSGTGTKACKSVGVGDGVILGAVEKLKMSLRGMHSQQNYLAVRYQKEPGNEKLQEKFEYIKNEICNAIPLQGFHSDASGKGLGPMLSQIS
ncbi:hypothetical protein NDU88_001014 [Pleurodeles waltl]|uniref:Uncharacterized protein n=1 Tax=Pleurodeles waltl TaxID=8319 RepID=A0AAV7Q8J7_PLEWA|nr:hypothetical protein NDU88_001014 [Pleurodeles waltl]